MIKENKDYVSVATELPTNQQTAIPIVTHANIGIAYPDTSRGNWWSVAGTLP